jgi:hypothetical protein
MIWQELGRDYCEDVEDVGPNGARCSNCVVFQYTERGTECFSIVANGVLETAMKELERRTVRPHPSQQKAPCDLKIYAG